MMSVSRSWQIDFKRYAWLRGNDDELTHRIATCSVMFKVINHIKYISITPGRAMEIKWFESSAGWRDIFGYLTYLFRPPIIKYLFPILVRPWSPCGWAVIIIFS